MKTKLDFDATKLFVALKYQIHIAIQYCQALRDCETLWVEVFGDVTVGTDSQIEVKFYKDDLTDSHENFWNTLNNWLKPDFNHEQYSNLILLTTQSIGKKAILKTWDKYSTRQRLAVLEEILDASEIRHSKSKKRGSLDAETCKPSQALVLQRKVLADEHRDSLLSALPKVRIVSDQPDLFETIEKYKRCYLRPIPPDRQDDYLDDLYGFMTNAGRMLNGWKITGAEFTAKITELTDRYRVRTVKFPKVDHQALEQKAKGMDVRERLFAKKLAEITGDSFIPKAAVELLHAELYIAELLKDFSISQSDIESYRRNHYEIHYYSRLSQIEGCQSQLTNAQLQTRSRAFYLQRCQESVAQFCSFENTPTQFRNGIYQMLADEPTAISSEEFHWRLWD